MRQRFTSTLAPVAALLASCGAHAPAQSPRPAQRTESTVVAAPPAAPPLSETPTQSAAPAEDPREDDARAELEATPDIARMVNEATGLRQFAALVRESGVPYPKEPGSIIAVIPDEVFTEKNAKVVAKLRKNKAALREVIECHMHVLRCTMKPGTTSMHVEQTDHGIGFSFGGPLMWKTEEPHILVVERLLTEEERVKGHD